MFKPVRGPKEGRSPPGLLYAGPVGGPRGKFSHRQITIALIVTVCFLLGYIVLNSEGGTVSSSPTTVIAKPGSGGLGDALLNDNVRNPPADTNVHEIHAGMSSQEETSRHRGSDQSQNNIKEHDYKPVREPLEEIYQQPTFPPSVEKVKQEKEKAKNEIEQTEALPGQPKEWGTTSHDKLPHADKSGPAPAREIWGSRPQFEKALSNVILRLPDEVHMRELIRPIEVSGKERMREIGLRTRAYKTYFDAWENLHMSFDSDGTPYIRDDVIQYLRSRQEVITGEEYVDEGVDGMNLAQTIRSYESFRVFLLKFANLLFPWTAPYYSDHMSLHASFKKGGRGIVLTVGDDQAPYLLTTIYTFRQLGCTLPIEVMYLGDQDLGEDYRMELESLPGVTTRDIAQMTDDQGWRLRGWAAKPFAILLSSFREVIFIDADSLFFKNPESLFDEPDYKKHGALFFRDRLIMPESKKRWLQQVLPKPIPKLAKQSRFWTGESGHMQESGVVVVDKWKHFIALMLVTRFNGPDRDGNKEKGIVGVYDMMYGDKETFWIGFLLAGDEDYAFHAGDAGIMGELKEKEKKKELRKRDEPVTEVAEVVQDVKTEALDQASLAQLGFPETGAEGEAEVALTTAIPPPGPTNPSLQYTPYEEEVATNYTICAPQLLHLDVEGKPLWFNGWLLQNKFAEKAKKRFANFDYYLIEPREVRNPGAWQLAESNLCCLTTDADKMFTFSAKEKAILKMMTDRATEMGMGDQT